jgi:hypothetical protein
VRSRIEAATPPTELWGMDATRRRAQADSRRTGSDPQPRVDARWNWWVLNHGSLIAGTLTAVALTTLVVSVVHDRDLAKPTLTAPATLLLDSTVTPSSSPVPSTSLLPQPTGSITSTPTSEPTTTVAAIVTSGTVLPATSAESSSAPTSTTAPVSTTTPAATTTSTATDATTTTDALSSTTVERSAVVRAALTLLHLQLALPATWIQVSRHVAYRQSSNATATAFTWVGPQNATARLQTATTAAQHTLGALNVRGHDAAVVASQDGITVFWSETTDVTVALHVTGVSESEAILMANASVVISNDAWTQLLQRAKVVSSPPWDRILTEDW